MNAARVTLLYSMMLGVACACISAPASGEEVVAVVNGHIHSMGSSGEITKGSIIARDGRIVDIGANVAVPAGARVIDAAGKVVTPGFIAADTSIGLMEIRLSADPADNTAQSQTISAAFDVSYGLNPESVVIPVDRLGGITTAVVVPTYGGGEKDSLFAGQAALITLAHGGQMLLKPRVAMVLGMGEEGAERGGGARGAEAATLRAILADVRDYARRRSEYDQGKTRRYLLSRADLEALVPVAEGRMPVLVWVRRASDIVDALSLAQQEHLRLILDGASEAWRVADRIAAAHVPVLLTPIENTPASFEALGSTLENAALLAKAGVTVVIKGNGTHRDRELRYNAGNAVAAGMSHSAALAAVTINPARVFGIADRVGSLDRGKAADLVIWEGDPFEPRTRPVAVLIGGREQPMTSRATALRDRYLPVTVSATH